MYRVRASERARVRACAFARRRSANTTGTRRSFNSGKLGQDVCCERPGPGPRARTLRPPAGGDANAPPPCRFRGNAPGPHRRRSVRATVLGHEFIGIAAARSRLMALSYVISRQGVFNMKYLAYKNNNNNNNIIVIIIAIPFGNYLPFVCVCRSL